MSDQQRLGVGSPDANIFGCTPTGDEEAEKRQTSMLRFSVTLFMRRLMFAAGWLACTRRKDQELKVASFFVAA